MINNLIWDVDGTLFDTYPAFINAYGQAVRDLGGTVPLNRISQLVRISLGHTAEMLSSQYGLDKRALEDGFQVHYASIAPANQLPFHGVRGLLSLVKSLGGVNLIVTHRGRESTERLLTAHNISDYFAQVYSAQDGYPHKPDPTMFFEAVKEHDLDPEHTLAVGDREIDIEAGLAASLYTCLFGQASHQVFTRADLQISAFSELQAFLEGKSP